MLNKRRVLLCYLAILPFLSGFAIPPLINFVPPDPREVPIYIGFIFVTCYFLWILTTGEIKKIPTAIPALFIAYNLLSMHLAPQVSVIFNHVAYPGIWLYKAFLFTLVYFLFFVAVFSEGLEVSKLFKIMQWSGLIMAIYMLLQFFHLDQFTQLAIDTRTDFTNSPEMGGAMWTPSIAAAFLAICVPSYLRSKNWWMVIPVIMTIVLTKSVIAMAASGFSLIFYLCYRLKRPSLFIVSIICAVIIFAPFHNKFEDHGRLRVWHKIIHEWKSAPIYQEINPNASKSEQDFLNSQNHHIYPITGMGPGSYVPLFTIKEDSPWKEGHNEFLEYFLYERGIVAAIFFLIAMIWIFRIIPTSLEIMILLSIFVSIMICSMGTFIWHLEPFRSFTCVVLALICALRKEGNNGYSNLV